MIEVEKKFRLDDEDKKRLLADAKFIGEYIMEDSYYDTSDFRLTTKDRWLRNRNGRWELKIPPHEKVSSKRLVHQYRELDSEEEIRLAINLSGSGNFHDDLEKNGFLPFLSIVTTRRKYKKRNFTIDIDELDFGYKVVEIELLVDNEDEIEGAVKRILDYASNIGLESTPVRGKILEHIHRRSPEHWKALEEAGVI